MTFKIPTKNILDLRDKEEENKISGSPDNSDNKEKEIAKVFVSWQAREFTKYEKDKNWFAIWLIISITIVTIAIIFKNFLFAIFAIFAALAVFIQALQEPRIITFKITARGLLIDRKLYNFLDLESFWIIYEPPEVKELYIKSKKLFIPQISISINKENPVKIRQALLNFLPEKEQRQSLVDIIARLLRF